MIIGGVTLNANSDKNYDFLTEFSEPVEKFGLPDDFTDDNTTKQQNNAVEYEFSEPLQPETDFKEQNTEISRELVEAADLLIAFLIALLIAKDTDLADKYKLPVESIEKIAKVAAKLMPSTHTVLSPAAELGLVIVGAYVPVIMQASLDRKDREERAEAEQKKQEMINRIKAKKRKAKMKILKTDNESNIAINDTNY